MTKKRGISPPPTEFHDEERRPSPGSSFSHQPSTNNDDKTIRPPLAKLDLPGTAAGRCRFSSEVIRMMGSEMLKRCAGPTSAIDLEGDEDGLMETWNRELEQLVYRTPANNRTVKDKAQHAVILDKSTSEKLYKDVQSYRLVTVAVLVDRLKINGSLARKCLADLEEKGQIKQVVGHSKMKIFSMLLLSPLGCQNFWQASSNTPQLAPSAAPIKRIPTYHDDTTRQNLFALAELCDDKIYIWDFGIIGHVFFYTRRNDILFPFSLGHDDLIAKKEGTGNDDRPTWPMNTMTRPRKQNFIP